jgi:hypothetical protein
MQTGSHRRETRPIAPAAKKMPLWARVLIALVIGNGLAYAAYVRFRNQSGPATAARPDIPEITETKISFASTPSGAKVSEQGVVLGVTPFIRTYPRMPEGLAREFTFELAQHSTARVQAFLDQERIYVHTSLAPLAAPEVTAKGEVAAPPPVEQVAERFERAPVRRSRGRELPRSRETRVASVPRLDDDARGVPKLDDGSGVPKLDQDTRGVPKLDDASGVPKLDQDARGVLKLDEDEKRGNVPKVSDDERGTPKLDDDEPSPSKRSVPKL